MPARFGVVLTCLLLCLELSLANPNATCAASHDCDAKGSILTVTPVFSSVTSLLDEALVGGGLRFMDSPSMRPAEFPVFIPAIEHKGMTTLLSTESFEGYLSAESESELGMF
jgi:hypothetical protein